MKNISIFIVLILMFGLTGCSKSLGKDEYKSELESIILNISDRNLKKLEKTREKYSSKDDLTIDEEVEMNIDICTYFIELDGEFLNELSKINCKDKEYKEYHNTIIRSLKYDRKRMEKALKVEKKKLPLSRKEKNEWSESDYKKAKKLSKKVSKYISAGNEAKEIAGFTLRNSIGINDEISDKIKKIGYY